MKWHFACTKDRDTYLLQTIQKVAICVFRDLYERRSWFKYGRSLGQLSVPKSSNSKSSLLTQKPLLPSTHKLPQNVYKICSDHRSIYAHCYSLKTHVTFVNFLKHFSHLWKLTRISPSSRQECDITIEISRTAVCSWRSSGVASSSDFIALVPPDKQSSEVI